MLNIALLVLAADKFCAPLTNHDGYVYTTFVGIGTPAQHISVVPDTGSYDLVAASTLCKSDACEKHHLFAPEHSTTYHSETRSNMLRYGQGDIAVLDTTDKVTFFGSASSNAQLHDGALVSVELIEQESLEGFKVAPYDGIMGMGKCKTNDLGGDAFLEDMNIEGFTLCLGDTKLSGSGVGGRLEMNSKLEVGGDYKKLDTVGQHVWGAPLDHVGVHGQPSSSECSEHSKCAAIIDSGTTLLTFPKSVVHSLYTAIEMGCSEADCLLTLQDQKECSGPHYNALPNLELRVGGVDLVLTPRVYMGEMDVDISAASMDETDGKGDRKIKNSHLDASIRDYEVGIRCVPMLSSMDERTTSGALVILGMPFLREYAVYFDRSDWGMSVAQIHGEHVCSKCGSGLDASMAALGGLDASVVALDGDADDDDGDNGDGGDGDGDDDDSDDDDVPPGRYAGEDHDDRKVDRDGRKTDRDSRRDDRDGRMDDRDGRKMTRDGRKTTRDDNSDNERKTDRDNRKSTRDDRSFDRDSRKTTRDDRKTTRDDRNSDRDTPHDTPGRRVAALDTLEQDESGDGDGGSGDGDGDSGLDAVLASEREAGRRAFARLSALDADGEDAPHGRFAGEDPDSRKSDRDGRKMDRDGRSDNRDDRKDTREGRKTGRDTNPEAVARDSRKTDRDDRKTTRDGRKTDRDSNRNSPGLDESLDEDADGEDAPHGRFAGEDPDNRKSDRDGRKMDRDGRSDNRDDRKDTREGRKTGRDTNPEAVARDSRKTDRDDRKTTRDGRKTDRDSNRNSPGLDESLDEDADGEDAPHGRFAGEDPDNRKSDRDGRKMDRDGRSDNRDDRKDTREGRKTGRDTNPEAVARDSRKTDRDDRKTTRDGRKTDRDSNRNSPGMLQALLPEAEVKVELPSVMLMLDDVNDTRASPMKVSLLRGPSFFGVPTMMLDENGDPITASTFTPGKDGKERLVAKPVRGNHNTKQMRVWVL
jgi:hypothetical protein